MCRLKQAELRYRELEAPAEGLAPIDRDGGAQDRDDRNARSVFVCRNRFHQGDELTLDRLILDLAVGAKQAEAEG